MPRPLPQTQDTVTCDTLDVLQYKVSHVKWSWAWCGGEPQDTITFDTLDGGSSGAVVGGGAGEGHRVLADGRWGLRERCRDLAFVAIKDDGPAVSWGVARGPGLAVELANRQVDLVIQEGEALLTARYTSLNSGLGIETGRRSTGDPKTFSAANIFIYSGAGPKGRHCVATYAKID